MTFCFGFSVIAVSGGHCDSRICSILPPALFCFLLVVSGIWPYLKNDFLNTIPIVCFFLVAWELICIKYIHVYIIASAKFEFDYHRIGVPWLLITH